MSGSSILAGIVGAHTYYFYAELPIIEWLLQCVYKLFMLANNNREQFHTLSAA